jgi:hypothetical protein
MKPERATENLRRDVETVKHRHAEDHTPRSTP